MWCLVVSDVLGLISSCVWCLRVSDFFLCLMSRCFWCVISYFFLSDFFLCLVSSCVWSPVVCCQVVRYLVLSVSRCAWCLGFGEGEHSDPVKCWRRPSSRPAAADLVPEAPSEFRLPKCAQYAHPNTLWRCVDFFFVLFGCLYFFGPFYDFYFIYEWLRLVCLNAVDFFTSKPGIFDQR